MCHSCLVQVLYKLLYYCWLKENAAHFCNLLVGFLCHLHPCHSLASFLTFLLPFFHIFCFPASLLSCTLLPCFPAFMYLLPCFHSCHHSYKFLTWFCAFLAVSMRAIYCFFLLPCFLASLLARILAICLHGFLLSYVQNSCNFASFPAFLFVCILAIFLLVS